MNLKFSFDNLLKTLFQVKAKQKYDNKYDPNGFKDEFSRLFRFKWDGTKLALGLVFCAG